MGYSSSGGPNGLGVFNTTPSTTSDLNQGVALIAQQGNSRVGTSTARTSLSGAQLYDGLLWAETDTDTLWQYTGSAWVSVYGGDTGWVPMTLSSGISAGSVAPSVRRIGVAVWFQGTVAPSVGSFAANSTIQIVDGSHLSTQFSSAITRNFVLSGNSANLQVRGIQGGSGTGIQIVTGPSVPAYVDLSGMFYLNN